MLRLTSQLETIAAVVLVVIGYQNIFFMQYFGFQEFPGFLSWLLILSGVYIGLFPFVKGPRDLGSSFVMVLIGVAGLYFGAELTMGTAGRMGPGYFPRLLSWLIIAIGIGVGSMALTVEGPPIDPPKFRPISFVLLSIVVFGYMMAYVGLIVTAFVMVLVAALARQEFKLGETIVLGLLMAVGTAVIFVYGLGQPLPDCPNGFRCTQWLPALWGG
jgi:hypothetical protein